MSFLKTFAYFFGVAVHFYDLEEAVRRLLSQYNHLYFPACRFLTSWTAQTVLFLCHKQSNDETSESCRYSDLEEDNQPLQCVSWDAQCVIYFYSNRQ